jgi:hypothetical protein
MHGLTSQCQRAGQSADRACSKAGDCRRR